MFGVTIYQSCLRYALAPLLVLVFAMTARAQSAGESAIDALEAQQAAQGKIVAEVRVEGNRTRDTKKVVNEIGTRVGRPFDKDQLQRDVRKLASKSWFLDVRPIVQQSPAGVIVTFQVVERPVLDYVRFIGNNKVKLKKLQELVELKAGMARDPYAVEEGRRRIEDHYKERGYNGVQVTILEGLKPKDLGATYLINEGVSQKIWKIVFDGNTIDSDSRLKTQIQSKPPILYLFKGQVNLEQINEDVDRLTAYYRSLGFFRARVGRELEWNEERNWLTLRFVIDEGPRYKVRNISVIGNTKFESGLLLAELKLKDGEFFDQPKMDADLGSIRDIYGSVGYVFADVQAETRFLEEPGQVDLVYNVAEGKRYRVGRINVKIEGEHPHTRQQAVRNRISLRPGDIVDIRKLRDSERRLKASGLFLNDPTQNTAPKLVILPPELGGEEEAIADERARNGKIRGQSPDSENDQTGLHETAFRDPSAPVVRWETPAGDSIDLFPLAEPPRPQHRQYDPEPAYPTDPAPDTERVIIRGQNAEPSSDTMLEWRRPESAAPAARTAPARTTEYNDYPRDGGSRPVKLTQFAPMGGGRTLGGMGRPQAYQPPPATPYNPPPANNPYLAPQAGGAALAPAGPVVPPDPYAPPGGYAPGGTGVYVDPNGLPAPQVQPPAQPGLFGNLLGNQGPVPVDENGFSPPTLEEPDGYVDIDSIVQETQTGRFMFGVGVNSNAGLVGSIVVDEQNFDWRRWPRNGWEDFRNGTAFRGAGQRFRLEAAPGTQVQRYLVNFQEPFLFDTPVSLGLNGFYFTRGYVAWLEQRLGGGATLGYQFTPDLVGTVGFTGQSVEVSNPRQPTPPALAEALGTTSIYTFSAQLAHDTRDNTFMSTEGHQISLKFDQTIGDFVFPRVVLEGRQFFPIRQRPDGSGRHVFSLVGQVGVTGDDTPIYERFYAGGFSTIRGFRFRGVGPYDMGVNVGGDFVMLASMEYMFPITADDMIRGVAFCDTGTIEQDVEINDYRVAPGFGLRLTVPALGPAPIALDFAFPVAFNGEDQRQVFSFFVGFGR